MRSEACGGENSEVHSRVGVNQSDVGEKKDEGKQGNEATSTDAACGLAKLSQIQAGRALHSRKTQCLLLLACCQYAFTRLS
jgi:hypothetical protein